MTAMDQPTVDGLNTYWVSKAAHDAGLKAVLSGLGGDELFGGYTSFRSYPRLRRLAFVSRIPGFAQSARFLSLLAPGRQRAKIRSLGDALSSPGSTFQLVRGLFTPQQVRELIHPDVWEAAQGRNAIICPAEKVMRNHHIEPWCEVAVAEQSLYMRNQLLRDADWTSMKHSLEVRVPLVDRKLGESLAARLASQSRGKVLLARSLRTPLPEAILRRRKTGFALPMQEWIARDIRAGTTILPPAKLLHPRASVVIDRLHAGILRGEIHWSRGWALHCLGSWLQTTN